MTLRYEDLKPPRFSLVVIDGRENLRIRPRRPFFLSIFLPVWLCIWTVAGFAVATRVMTNGLNLFLVFWLGMWAMGWGYAAFQLAWIFGGSETLSVHDGGLDVIYRVLGVPIQRIYRGNEIRNLKANGDSHPPYLSRSNIPVLPFLPSNRTGCIKFSYGARTIYAGGDLDEEEGRRIAEWLLKRLPSSAGPKAT